MACDCAAIAASILQGQIDVIVAQASVDVAQSVLSTAQMQLWYDQYNYYLCGCGGNQTMMASIENEILSRDLAVCATGSESLRRLHELVLSQIPAKRRVE